MELTLSEELMLLALNDDDGDVIFSASIAIPFGLAGALLLEMIFRKNIELEDDKIKIGENHNFEKEIYADIAQMIKEEPDTKDLKFWIWKIQNKVADIKDSIVQRLIEKGILTKKEGKMFWLIKYEKYPQMNPIPEIETRLAIRKVVLEGHDPDAKTLALISLVHSCNLVDELFTKDERKQARTIIKRIIENEEVGKSVSKVFADTSIAISGAVSAAAVTINVNV